MTIEFSWCIILYLFFIHSNTHATVFYKTYQCFSTSIFYACSLVHTQSHNKQEFLNRQEKQGLNETLCLRVCEACIAPF